MLSENEKDNLDLFPLLLRRLMSPKQCSPCKHCHHGKDETGRGWGDWGQKHRDERRRYRSAADVWGGIAGKLKGGCVER